MTKDNFHTTHTFSQQKGNQQCERMVQRFLHARAWPKGGPQAKLRAEDNRLLYNDTATALANIKVHYLKRLTPADRLIENSQGQLLARIDAFTIDYYNRHQFHHLFEIELNQFPAQSPCKGLNLIDLNWIELDQEGTSQSAAFDPASRPAYIEQQDELLLQFHQQRIKAKTLHAYRIKHGELQFEPDHQRPLQAHHPVFINSKPQYNFGHLTDVHISSRQHVFHKSKAQVIPGMGKQAGSEHIGNRVHRSFDALYNLMDQFGNHPFADGIVFTGDLIDYNRNFNPGCTQGQAIQNTAALWQAMNLDHATDNDQYPNGIDNLIFYSLVRWFYDTYQKPIFLCAGNHEAYSLPYGISPRVVLDSSFTGKLASDLWSVVSPTQLGKRIADKLRGTTEPTLQESLDAVLKANSELEQARQAQAAKKEEPINGIRANEGIPVDHNLTVYEACLMYGKQYYRTPMAGASAGPQRNFQPQNLDWFQLIFTPFTDVLYDWPQQTLSLLAWGDDEKFIDVIGGSKRNPGTRDTLRDKGQPGIAFAPGTLPRATQAIDDDQLRLLQSALQRGKPRNLIAAHFTFINYNMPMSQQDQGVIGVGPLGDGLGHFDWGTFERNRLPVYRDILASGKVQVTLSGHSHRAGLYQLKDEVPGRGFDAGRLLYKAHAQQELQAWLGEDPKLDYDYAVASLPMRLEDGCDPIKIYRAPDPDRARIVVSACGGPIAVQNYCDELAGLGMERPSGSLVRFDAIGEQPIEIKVLEAQSKRNGIDTAKPRFCVAVDFMDLMKGKPQARRSGVFDSLLLTCNLDKTGMYGMLIRIGARLPEANLIKRVTLTFFVQDVVERYPLGGRRLKPGELGGRAEHAHQYWFTVQSRAASSGASDWFNEGLTAYLDEKRKGMRKAFLSVEFDPSIKSAKKDGLPVYQQYDFASEWIIPIEIADNRLQNTARGQRALKLQKGNYEVFRHPVWGEIPEFGWYQSVRGDEYGGSAEDEDQQERR
jgi:hypothetical protein